MRQYTWLLGLLGGIAALSFVAYASFSDTIAMPWSVTGGVGVALIATWLWLDREALGRMASGRGFRYSITASAMVVMALAITVTVNVLGHRYDHRWDLTSSQKFSLSDQTLKVLDGLDTDVQVLGFFSSGSPEEATFKDLIAGYEEHSDHLKVELHDPLREPMMAQQNAITQSYGTVILLSGSDKQRLESDLGEEALTNALIKLTSGVQHTVCLTTGHEELDPEDIQGGAGFGAVKSKLEGQNYTVKTVVLAREGRVPADCEVLASIDPQADWLPVEREIMAAYLAGGGSVMMMLDPMHAPQLAADMARYGVAVGNDLVLEQNPNYQLVGGDPSYIFLDSSSFNPHPITEPMKGPALMRVARTVGKGESVDGIDVQELAHTTEYAWAETSLDGTVAPAPDPGQDRIGAVPLAAVAEINDPQAIKVGARSMGAGAAKPEVLDAEPAQAEAPVTRKKGGKLVIFGDSDFASNELLDQVSNQDLVLNTIAWLVGEEDQVSIRPNAAGTGTFSMNVVQGILVWLASLLFVPGALLVGAIVTWRRRRSQ